MRTKGELPVFQTHFLSASLSLSLETVVYMLLARVISRQLSANAQSSTNQVQSARGLLVWTYTHCISIKTLFINTGL